MRYLDSTPFSVAVGESKTFRDNWTETFGRFVLKTKDGRFLARDTLEGEWKLVPTAGEAATFKGRSAAEEAAFEAPTAVGLLPSDVTTEPV
jgi:hypothetical protein